MKDLKILAILTISSLLLVGCQSLPVVATCPDDRPTLELIDEVTQEELFTASPEGLSAIARNDIRLKEHIKYLEGLIAAHNELYGVDCESD